MLLMEYVIRSRTEDSSMIPCFLLIFSKINSTAPPFLMPNVSSPIPSRLIRQYSVFYVLCQSSARYISAADTVCNNICFNTNVNGLSIYPPSYVFTTLNVIVFSVSFS